MIIGRTGGPGVPLIMWSTLAPIALQVGPQAVGGAAGAAITKRAVDNDDLRLYLPVDRAPNWGRYGDVRFAGALGLSALGLGLMATRSPFVRLLGAAVLALGGALGGSLVATELVREKTLALKGAKAPERAKISTMGDFADEWLGADGCGEEDDSYGDDDYGYDDSAAYSGGYHLG